MDIIPHSSRELIQNAIRQSSSKNNNIDYIRRYPENLEYVHKTIDSLSKLLNGQYQLSHDCIYEVFMIYQGRTFKIIYCPFIQSTTEYDEVYVFLQKPCGAFYDYLINLNSSIEALHELFFQIL